MARKVRAKAAIPAAPEVPVGIAAKPALATKAEAAAIARAAAELLDVARRLARMASEPATSAWRAHDLRADAAVLLETAARGLRLAAGENDR